MIEHQFVCQKCGKSMTIADYLLSPICYTCTKEEHEKFLRGERNNE